jgi:hypothetical protein
MAVHDKELIDALSSAKILTSMITPAVLISACGTLIFSTAGRLGRLFDRVNSLKSEVEEILLGKLSLHDERMAHIKEQLSRQRLRSVFLQRALSALYTATALFIASSLAIALNVAYGSPETAWVPTAIALLGGLFLFVASVLLIYESRYNLRFINSHIDFIAFLQNDHEKTRKE